MLVDLSRPVWKPSLASCAILPLFVKSPSYSGVGEESLTLGPHSFADFMTYFGAFSLKKWRLYTGIEDLTPVLVVESSAPVHITLTEMIYRVLRNALSMKLRLILYGPRTDGIVMRFPTPRGWMLSWSPLR